MAGFRSLRERTAGAPDPHEVLPLTVLPYMWQPLWDWLADACVSRWSDSRWSLLAKMLKIDYTGRTEDSAIWQAATQDDDLLLDLIDACLALNDPEVVEKVEHLKLAFFLAGSGWKVNEAEDGLEQVVDETVRSVALSAIEDAEGSASSHLAKAWAETFGRTSNPTLAHAEMIRAVESAAVPVVTPNDQRATLGTLIGQMAGQGHLYTTAGASDLNDGIEGVVEMMKMLWQQQTDRHGSNPTVPATQERVEMLLPLAACLVHMFSSGAVRRK